MVYNVRSLGLHGVAGYEVSVECDLSGGLPAFTMVGSLVHIGKIKVFEVFNDLFQPVYSTFYLS